MKKITILFLAIFSISSCSKDEVITPEIEQSYKTVTTIAGLANTQGTADGQGTAASFYWPYSMDFDSNGNLYVADSGNKLIRKISPSGAVSTLSITGAITDFNNLNALVVDSQDNIYVSDNGSRRIYKMTTSGVTTFIAGSNFGYTDGTGAQAQFYSITGMNVDANDNVYVCDYNGIGVTSVIRKVTPEGVVTTFVPNNSAFSYIEDFVFGKDGNMYLAGVNSIFKVTPNGTVSVFASGSRTENGVSIENFTSIYEIDQDSYGNFYVTDYTKHQITKITSSGVVSTLAGSTSGQVDGAIENAKFNGPTGIIIDDNDNIYVSDYTGNTIRKITK